MYAIMVSERIGGILVEKRRKSDIAIGKNMADMRNKFNLTQKEVAQVVGVNVSTYKHYELGDRATPLSVIRDLATLYKISTNYFFEKKYYLMNTFKITILFIINCFVIKEK